MWAFAAMDLLLLGSAAWLVYTSPRPIHPLLGVYCGVLFIAGATFFCLPFVMQSPAQRKRPATEKLPKWLLGDTPSLGTGKQILVHLHWPRFAGEITRLPTGQRGIHPIWIDAPVDLSAFRKSQLLREGVEFFERETGERNAPPDTLL